MMDSLIDRSSRAGSAAGESIAGLVPEPVARYIEQRRLYLADGTNNRS